MRLTGVKIVNRAPGVGAGRHDVRERPEWAPGDAPPTEMEVCRMIESRRHRRACERAEARKRNRPDPKSSAAVDLTGAPV